MNENKTNEIIEEGDKFLILLDSILELIDKWKENYVPTPEKDVVPDVLDFEPGDTVYFMTSFGESEDYLYFECAAEEKTQKTHRVFKTPEMAEMYRDKTQVIANMLFFKQLYDAEFEPDWVTKQLR